MSEALLTTSVPSGKLVSRGKVRDIYATDEALILVATDRISAFDSVLSPGIAGRGEILTRLSNFWFWRFSDRVPNHLLATELADFPEPFNDHPELAGRSVLAQRLDPVPVECVARGYLAGSGWKEYQVDGTVCGIGLPEGLTESAELPEPIFTPATKATDGHDENISFERMVGIVGEETATRLRDLTLELYTAAADYARDRGILIADTKFEFGFDADGTIGRPTTTSPGAPRHPSTSSTCATGSRPVDGTRSRPLRPFRPRSLRVPSHAISRPIAC